MKTKKLKMRRDSRGSTQSKKKSLHPESTGKKNESSGKKFVQPRLQFKVLLPAVSGIVNNDNDDITIIIDDEKDQAKNEYDGKVDDSKDSPSVNFRKRKLSYGSDEMTSVTILSKESADREIVKDNLDVSSVGTKEVNIGVNLIDTDEEVDDDEETTDDSNHIKMSQHLLPVKVKLPFHSAKKRRKASIKANSDHIDETNKKLNPLKRVKVDNKPQDDDDDNPVNKNLDVIEIESESEIEAENVHSNDDRNIDNKKHKLDVSKRKSITSEKSITMSAFLQGSSTKTAIGTDIKETKENQKTLHSAEKSQDSPPITEPQIKDNDKVTIFDMNESTNSEKEHTPIEVSCDDDNPEPSNKTNSNNQMQESAKIDQLHIIPATMERTKQLTPKQIKLNEQRKKAREEKEHKLQEERLQKQREKEEKELAKKQEREEKERKRVVEMELKNEEKRKRNELKESELRKKEEEKKRKELEKVEVEEKKKKAAEGFKRFFVAKEAQVTSSNDSNIAIHDVDDVAIEVLAFRPFQLRADMRLAPIARKQLTIEAKNTIDVLIRQTSNFTDENGEIQRPKSTLYLSELRNGNIIPGRWIKSIVSTKEVESDDGVYIMEDELERAGQAITEETHKPLERLRAKFFKFTENRRPPYFGTWRKTTQIITPRRPFAQDKNYFDYEVESDLEWEEEEPGESLDGSDDEKDKESEDDDYEVDNDWFVPHGHLSDEEMQNEEGYGGMEKGNDREAQQAKLKLLQQEFAQEMKKKTEKLKPRLIGCVWVDENGNKPLSCPNIIWESLAKRAMLCVSTLQIVDDEDVPCEKTDRDRSPSTANATTEKLKPITLTKSMLMDLVRLLHGNCNSKAFLISEFIAHIEANEEAIRNGEVRCPRKSTVREKIEEFAEWMAHETDDKKSKTMKKKKRMCWMVSPDLLNRMELSDLSIYNTWQYKLSPKLKTTDHKTTAQRLTDNIHNAGNDDTGCIPTDADKLVSSDSIDSKSIAGKVNDEIDAKSTIPHQNGPDIPPASIPIDPPLPITGTALVKKRVPLLMSVPRGQQFSPLSKNALISQFLTSNRKTDETTMKQQYSCEDTPIIARTEDKDVVLLE